MSAARIDATIAAIAGTPVNAQLLRRPLADKQAELSATAIPESLKCLLA
jgi:hypothetical protein